MHPAAVNSYKTHKLSTSISIYDLLQKCNTSNYGARYLTCCYPAKYIGAPRQFLCVDGANRAIGLISAALAGAFGHPRASFHAWASFWLSLLVKLASGHQQRGVL